MEFDSDFFDGRQTLVSGASIGGRGTRSYSLILTKLVLSLIAIISVLDLFELRLDNIFGACRCDHREQRLQIVFLFHWYKFLLIFEIH